MKKTIALVLTLAMLLACTAALAENTYDGDIKFAGHVFGESFTDVISSSENPLAGIYFYNFFRNTNMRSIADPIYDNYFGSMSVYSPLPLGFECGFNGSMQVAGFDASVSYYFMYQNAEDSKAVALNNAKLIGGRYSFWANNSTELEGRFENLKEKMTSVYGEPFGVAEDSDEIFGAPDLTGMDEWVSQNIQETKNRYQIKKFAAWKNAANDRMVVLSFIADEWNGQLYLSYIDLSADAALEELFNAINVGGASTNNSTDGL